MTEDEVKELEEKINESAPDDPKIEMEWLETIQKETETTLKRMRAEFRMWKFLRDDDKIKQVSTMVEERKNWMEYLKKRIAELKEVQ